MRPCGGARGTIWWGHAVRGWCALALALGAVVALLAPASPALAAGSGPPGAPRSLVVTSGDGSLTFKWSVPASAGAGITGYVVTPTVDGVAGAERTFGTSSTIQVVDGLPNGSSVSLAVAAIGPGGRGPAASIGPTTVGLPGKPPFPGATSGDGSATVSWWAAAPNGSPITGYVVTPYLGTTALAPRTFATPARTQVITGLTNGSTYTFQVAAVSAVGTGPAAATAATTVGLPGAITSPKLTSGDGAVTLSWTAAPGNGSPITGYVVTPYLGSTALAPTTFASAATTQVVGGLANGSSYTFKVVAQNAVGAGPAVTTAAVTVGLPGTTAFPTAVPGDGTAKVSWWGALGNGSPITGYVVTPYVGSQALAPRTFSSTATTQTITGLANGTAYTFKIAGVNAVGTGPASTTAAMTVGTPGIPTKVTAVAGPAGSGTATVSWVPATGTWSATTSYRVTPYAGPTALPVRSFDATATTRTITGLAANASYAFKVTAVNAVGPGLPSAASTSVALVAGLPGAPTDASAAAGDRQAVVRWTPPASTGAVPLVRYLVTPWAGSTSLAPTIAGPSATQVVVAGLANGTSYRFTVAAVNAVGSGTASTSTGAVVPFGPPTAPGTPTAVGYRGSVMLTWTGPADANGAPVSGYVVTPSVDGVDQPPIHFDDPSTQELVEGLADGVAYRFRVAAVNAAGTGDPSAASTATTTLVAPEPTPGTIDVVGDSLLFQATENRRSEFAGEGQPDDTDAITYPYIGMGFHEALPDERRRVVTGGRPSALVLALGTNDSNPDNGGWTTADLADYRAMLHLPSPDACVVVVLPGLGEAASSGRHANEAVARADMARLAAARPNTVVVDWQAEVDAHPELLGPDGVHLAEDGEVAGQRASGAAADAYASTIWQGVAQCPPATIGPAQGFRSLANPVALAFDGEDRALLADTANHRVLSLEPGHAQQPVDFGPLDLPTGVAFGPDGSGYVSDRGTGRVLRRSPEGDVATLPFDGLVAPAGLVVSSDGTVYVADMGAGRVVALDASGGQRTIGFTGLASPVGLALEPDGTLLVSDMALGQVRSLDPAGHEEVLDFGVLHAPVGVTVGPDGSVVVADVVASKVLARHPDGTVDDLTPDGATSPIWVAFDEDGGQWTVEYSESRVIPPTS
ncbi:MAG: fibronectin type III domain-containing protein [Acidimicrobiales bacterium]